MASTPPLPESQQQQQLPDDAGHHNLVHPPPRRQVTAVAFSPLPPNLVAQHTPATTNAASATTPVHQVLIYHTVSGAYFAQLLSHHLGCPIKQITRKSFGDGEQYYKVEITGRTELVGTDAIFVTATATDADLLDLFRVGCELAMLGTRRRIFVIPYLGYSTMERAVLPGEIITAKMNARMLSAIPNSGLGNVFLLMDLHVAGLLQYFEGQAQRMELYAEGFLTEAIIKHVDFSKGDVIFGSADLGRPLWVQSFANKFNTGIAFIRKTRSFGKTAVVGTPIGDVAGKRVVIYDDMTRSAGTLINAAESYRAHGATDVIAVLSHLALNNEEVVHTLEKSNISLVISTNTHPMSNHPSVLASKKFVICDVSSIFADTIKSIELFQEACISPASLI